MIKVFVYGTLRKEEKNHRLIESAMCISENCWTEGKLYDTGYGYPAMTQSSSDKTYGELYSVTDNELIQLDLLEGYTVGGKDNLYERIEQTVYTDKGNLVAYMYIANKKNLLKKEISNGDWKEYSLI
ncbi:gamma-glutamylcyclotransferase family protein [Peribacillus alkalitolerans]|uniref:gamma-glutamylcyclotransferase family protein n=1 Tax=Peribacillus alkalitolerans TaxID=1550385 RepID=UPI0013D8BD15|nr:gamma-glutamylcyclotransferase family protein [Peribacillus alkalitolerans]